MGDVLCGTDRGEGERLFWILKLDRAPKFRRSQ